VLNYKEVQVILCLLVPQCGLVDSIVITKLLQLHPYKITAIHILLYPDYEAIIQYCTKFRESVFSGLFDPEYMIYSTNFNAAKRSETRLHKETVYRPRLKCHIQKTTA
jgi:hypothetical protein